MITLAQVLEWKYGPVAGTRQVDPKKRSRNPKMMISSWKHATIPQPSEAQIGEDFKEYEDYLDSIKYQKERAEEYPSVVDQLDMIYHDIDAWRAEIKKVKDGHPKPE